MLHPSRPQALVVEDQRQHADFVRQHLVNVGFEVVVVPTLVDATREAQKLLHPAQPFRPTLVLVDITGVQPGHPEVEGSNWVAVLVREMQQSRLHPATIVAISGYLTKERISEARVAGCHERVLEKPLTDADAIWLRQLVTQRATIPHAHIPPHQHAIIEAFQATSTRIMQALVFDRGIHWTEDDAYLVLRGLTSYPEQRDELHDDQDSTANLINRLGGVDPAREQLRRIASQIQSRYPVHSLILIKFLEGWKRSEIVKHFVEQDLYDASYIYNLHHTIDCGPHPIPL